MIVQATRRLSREVGQLSFGPPVAHVYNPLEYAWEAHEAYLRRFAGGTKEVVLLGMNPGPWGMAQTGVPFGEVGLVRDWLGIEARVKRPAREHPKRPVLGFHCPRSEVSGARLWGWAQRRFTSPDRFFRRFFVANYCPLVFMEASGRNLTPDKLASGERAPLLAVCDEYLGRWFEVLKPKYVVGVGKFAEDRTRAVLRDTKVTIGCILHPSPASPAANRDWEGTIERQLRELGIGLR